MRRVILWVLAALLLLTGGRASGQASGQALDPVEALLAELTLEQKVGQMFLIALYGPTLNAPGRDLLTEWQPGGAVLFVSNAGDPAQVTRLTNSWQQAITDAGGVPLFIATDQEGGVIARLKEGFTTWPVPMLLTATGDLALAQDVGAAMAQELRAVGVNMNLAPVADLYTNLSNPIIGRRSFGSDPVLTGRMLAATVRGLQAGGVMGTAKHFPGHGDTDQDSHTSLPVVTHSRESLSEIELEPFRWTIRAGVEAVMVAHIHYPALDPEPRPASLSPRIVTDLLRDELGFQGLIMTDAIEMDAIDRSYSYEEASLLAIEAGVDIVAFGAHLGPITQAAAMQAVVDAVRAGRISEDRIDASVRRILDAKRRYGVLDFQPLDDASAAARVGAEAHSALVQQLFEAGITEAHDPADLVPIDPARSVTVIYPAARADIRRACEAYRADTDAATRWVLVSDQPDPQQINQAVSQAALSDQVVVFTWNAEFISGQQALVQALPREKTAAVALFSPYDWQAFPDVAAYLTTYSPLDPGVPAACAVLFGGRAAPGELPVALDGVRDFRDSLVYVERTAIAAAPTEDPRTRAALTETATRAVPTATPGPTLTAAPPTLTATPLPTVTRDAPTAVAVAQSLATLVTPTIGTPGTPLPETATAPPVIAEPSGPDSGNAPAPTLLIGGGLLLLSGVGLAAVTVRRGGVGADKGVIACCPACGSASLKRGKWRGRRAIRCESCQSTLREVGGGQWLWRINPRANESLHRDWHNQRIDTRRLQALADAAQRRGGE